MATQKGTRKRGLMLPLPEMILASNKLKNQLAEDTNYIIGRSNGIIVGQSSNVLDFRTLDVPVTKESQTSNFGPNFLDRPNRALFWVVEVEDSKLRGLTANLRLLAAEYGIIDGTFDGYALEPDETRWDDQRALMADARVRKQYTSGNSCPTVSREASNGEVAA